MSAAGNKAVYLPHLYQDYSIMCIYFEMSHENQVSMSFSCVNSGAIHREKRQYLRGALKELFKVLEDEPGLLGPKVDPQ